MALVQTGELLAGFDSKARISSLVCSHPISLSRSNPDAVASLCPGGIRDVHRPVGLDGSLPGFGPSCASPVTGFLAVVIRSLVCLGVLRPCRLALAFVGFWPRDHLQVGLEILGEEFWACGRFGEIFWPMLERVLSGPVVRQPGAVDSNRCGGGVGTKDG